MSARLLRLHASDLRFAPAGKKPRPSACGDWQWSVCVANQGDCGLGTREGTRTGADCKQTIKTQRCKIPCNWKKKFGGKTAPACLRHANERAEAN